MKIVILDGYTVNPGDLSYAGFEALESGKVYAAAVDVVSSEPIRADNVLLKAKNCIITPHIAWAAIDSRRRIIEIALANLQAFLSGRPVNVVNGI